MTRSPRKIYFILFLLPMALLAALAFVWGHENSSAVWVRNAWFWAHTGSILAGLSGLITAVSSAGLYLWQSAQLKSKHPGEMFLKLPSLDTLDKIHFRALIGGIILFSLGILSGLFWASNKQELGGILHDPKVLLSFLTCAIYWLIVSMRLSAMRRGQKIALGTLLAFGLLFATFMSSVYLPSYFHRGI